MNPVKTLTRKDLEERSLTLNLPDSTRFDGSLKVIRWFTLLGLRLKVSQTKKHKGDTAPTDGTNEVPRDSNGRSHTQLTQEKLSFDSDMTLRILDHNYPLYHPINKCTRPIISRAPYGIHLILNSFSKLQEFTISMCNNNKNIYFSGNLGYLTNFKNL